MAKQDKVSITVIRRLPRYYRFLQQLAKQGITRISSSELAARMGLTASQIRQDLNCFGGFGQQGYGYDVEKLYDEIKNILGLGHNYKAVMIGVGNLGKAVASHIAFADRGFTLDAIFDKNPEFIGSDVGGITVRDVAGLADYCENQKPDAAFLCLPYDSVEPIAEILYSSGIRAFWNFSHFDLTLKYNDVVMENVHMSDSLMTLCYRMSAAESPTAQE